MTRRLLSVAQRRKAMQTLMTEWLRNTGHRRPAAAARALALDAYPVKRRSAR